ncbi:UDP-N-acetylmuramoyl-L-alanine--D-glutamate ligase [Candidatus Sumerlaeota bacterium]|nr:UDP-N-acetylmuramoyl-L-alanine--D-glutamate ligase [Candidatus Sumerlaeota bacterium]
MNNSSDLLEHRGFVVFGAARSGLAAARLLAGLGKKVLLYDEAPAEKLADAKKQADAIGVALTDDSGELGFGRGWEVMILSPGIPTSHPVVALASEAGCVVRSELELGYLACRAPIAAITGTNGKTTVTHLLTHLIARAGNPVLMAGNVGRALCDAVLDPAAGRADARVVCEVSSYQLETIERFRPRVACVLNVTPDHLDRYGTFQNYVEAKGRITENQTAEDHLVLNADDAYCLSFTPRTHARVWRFSVRSPVVPGAFLRDDALVLSPGDDRPELPIMTRSEIPLPGLHNVQNVLAALCMAAAMRIDPRGMAESVRTFPPVPHRIEPVGEIDGVRFYNDSKATNLDSLEKALESLDVPIVLIAGGRDKGAPWTRLNDLVARRVKGLVLIGEAAPIGREAWGRIVPRVEDASDMCDAVRRAREMASPGDAVLLSPACASFDMYRNFEERGDHFRSIVAEMSEERTPHP